MQDQGHSGTHHAQDLATTLFPTAYHLLFTRDAGKVHGPSLPHVPGPEKPLHLGHKTGRISPYQELALGCSWGGGIARTTGPSPPAWGCRVCPG